MFFLGVALLCSLSVFAQTLSGVVTDQKSREGLISATVQLIAGDGKINYTSTDLKGMFQFKKLPAGTYTLQISYVGYKTYKEAVIIPSSGEKKVNVTMREDVNLLDESLLMRVLHVPSRKETVCCIMLRPLK